MNKKFISLALFGALLLASTGAFVSCQDYDDDIKNLQGQIDTNKNEIDQIKKLVNSGQWVQSVAKSDNGIIVTMGDGTTFNITNGKDGTNGSNGTNGVDGKPGTVVTLSANGEWLLDGKPTGRYGIAKDGVDGTPGENGKDGVYFVPGTEGTEAGFWVKVDPSAGTRTVTSDSWKTAGSDNVTAVMSGSNLILTVDGVAYTLPTGVATLRSMVFVPDMMLDGIPAIECSLLKFQPLKKTSGMTGTVVKDGSAMACTPAVEANYHLNPSNVTAEMINTDGLEFVYKEANAVFTRSSAALKNKKATYVDINNGKIKVTASLDGLNLYNTKTVSTKKYDLIALQAPVSAAAKSFSSDAPEVVTSDYVTLYGGDEYSGDDLYPAHKAILPTAADDAHYKTILQDAKDMLLTDPRVLKVVYNSNIKIGDYVETCFKEGTNHKVFPYSDRYHLSYKFDMEGISFKMTESGLLVETEQQEFITLDETTGVATPKVYSEGTSKAAIGRTPIIRACLVHSENGVDKIVKVVYIKLEITDEQGSTPEPGVKTFELSLADQKQSLCAPVTTEITAEQMNVKVYSKLGLSKEGFHKIYTFDATESANVAESQNAGGQKTYGLTWTIAPRTLWDNAAGSLSAQAVYKATNGDKIIIKLSAKVADKEIVTIPADKKISNYWNDDYTETKLNVAIPKVGETNSALCVFDNNLNAPFYTDGNGKLAIIPTSGLYAGADVDYVFASNPVSSPSGYSFTLKNNNTELWIGSEKIATIDNALAAAPWNTIALNENSDKAKELLNTNNFVVNLQLKADKCGFNVPFENNGVIKARFLRPVNIKTTAPGNFIDGVDFGATGSILAPASVVSYYDWRGKWETNYPAYYGVTGATIDTNRAITCNLGMNNAWINLPVTLEVGIDANGNYYYKNNSVVLGKPFDLKLPIKVTYKWGTVNTEVTVHVEATGIAQGAKRK